MTYLQLLRRVAQIDKISQVVPFLIAGHIYHRLDFNVSRSSEWEVDNIIIDNWFAGINLHNEAPSLTWVCMHVRHINWDFDVYLLN